MTSRGDASIGRRVRAAIVIAAAGLLVLAGGLKAWSPDDVSAFVGSLLQVRTAPWHGRALGVAEVALGAWLLLRRGNRASVALAILAYTTFAMVHLTSLVAGGTKVGCACLGRGLSNVLGATAQHWSMLAISVVLVCGLAWTVRGIERRMRTGGVTGV